MGLRPEAGFKQHLLCVRMQDAILNLFFYATVHLVCTDNRLSGNLELGKTSHIKVARLVKKEYLPLVTYVCEPPLGRNYFSGTELKKYRN